MPYDGAVGGFRLRWDVFLSFRGEDTRHTITNSLYDSLVRRGVRVFRDDDALNRGDEIAPSLLEAIDDSAAAVVVLSPRYADSSWCLEELAKICHGGRRLILPVFYQVDPSDVRRQSGPFEKDFRSHEMRFESSKVCEWRKAMAKVGGIAGFVFDSSKEADLIQSLVKTVLAEINRTPVGLAAYTVGLDSRIEDMMRLLDVRSSDVRVVGIHGMGGVGKTTLATAIFNRLVGKFDGHSFISKVREVSTGHKGLVSLQNKLINNLSPGVMPVTDTETGISAIKALVYDKRVLVVLDDVDNVNQLSASVGKGQWFNEGSRIIITTRDKGLLPSYLVNFKLYEVRELQESQALQLFSYHALRRDEPTGNFLDLSEKIVSLTGGLPLALEVFGSFLFDKRRIEEWTDALHKLKKIRPQHLQDVLKISYDALDEQEKCIFLDIACLLVKMNPKREYAIDILRSCGFEGEIAIADLTAKSLIKITEDTTLWMHDQLRDMGRQIVIHENLLDPGMRSRLWEHDKIINVFKDDKGTRCIQGIVLEDLDTERKLNGPRDLTGDKISWNNFRSSPNFTSATTYLKERYKVYLQNEAEKKSRITIHSKPFGAMVNLRLLQMNYVNLEGRFKFLPSELKWLQWKGCPLKSLPSVLFLPQLAGLDLSKSKVERLCSGNKNKVAEKLMFLNLSGCSSLTAIPDLSGNHALEKLILKYCVGLIKLHDSIGNLNTLVYLNLEGCVNLVELPSDVSGLRRLENLNLYGCSQLKRLPKNIGSMVSLKEFVLDETSIESLPETIFHLTKLEKLSLNRCRALKGLPDSIGSLANLEILSLFWCSFCRLPASLSGMSVLQELLLPHCRKLKSLPPLPSSLKKVDIANCIALESISDVSNLENLTELNLTNCEKVEDIPGLECLNSLVRLYMSGCKACSSAVKRRLAKKSYLRKIRNLSMPGSKIPDWFSQETVTFSKRGNRPLKSVILCVVVSLNHQIPDDLREEFPAVVDIQAQILILDSPIFTTTLILSGVPNTNDDQFHLCPYSIGHPLVSQLKDGYRIHVMRREPPYVKGVELKKWGIHLVYEGDDDYEGDEESLNESHQSLSEKLAKFFGSFDDEEADFTSGIEQDDCISATRDGEDEGMPMAQEIRESEQRIWLHDRHYFVSFFLVLSLVFLSLSWLYLWV